MHLAEGRKRPWKSHWGITWRDNHTPTFTVQDENNHQMPRCTCIPLMSPGVTSVAPTSAPAGGRRARDYPCDEDHEEKDQQAVGLLLHPHHHLLLLRDSSCPWSEWAQFRVKQEEEEKKKRCRHFAEWMNLRQQVEIRRGEGVRLGVTGVAGLLLWSWRLSGLVQLTGLDSRLLMHHLYVYNGGREETELDTPTPITPSHTLFLWKRSESFLRASRLPPQTFFPLLLLPLLPLLSAVCVCVCAQQSYFPSAEALWHD